MPNRQIEFFFDFGSPASYLAYTQLPALAAGCGAGIDWRPMLLGGVFKETGNSSPVAIPAKRRWMVGDLKRWAAHYGVPFEINPHFPINTLLLMRGAVGYQARQPEDFPRYVDLVFRSLWVEGRKLDDPAVLAQTLAEGKLDAARFMSMASDPEVKEALVNNTAEAVRRGVFGAPTFFVGTEMFFGQDRLAFVRQAAAARDA
jgi:2-hydroxychromene-2-carboxylate isomerase